MTDEEKPKKKVVLVKIKIIHTKGQSDLVEWVEKGMTKRGYIPTVMVGDGNVEKELLDHATPYGLPWGDMFSVNFDPEQIEEALHQTGIWTADDLRKNPKLVTGVLSGLLNLNYGALLSAAKQYSMEVKEL